MRQVIVALLLAVAGALFAAPAPLPRKKLAQVTAGDWTYTWSDHTNSMTLHEDGRYECVWQYHKFTGCWEWDRRTRVMTIWEKCGKENWWLPRHQLTQFRFTLDRDLRIDRSAENTGYMKSMRRGKFTPPTDDGPKLEL